MVYIFISIIYLLLFHSCFFSQLNMCQVLYFVFPIDREGHLACQVHASSKSYSPTNILLIFPSIPPLSCTPRAIYRANHPTNLHGLWDVRGNLTIQRKSMQSLGEHANLTQGQVCTGTVTGATALLIVLPCTSSLRIGDWLRKDGEFATFE